MLGNSKSKISPKTISLSFGILVLLFSLSFIAFAWTEPTLAPPSGNADAPLNVGTTAQTKNARLSVTELYDANDSAYYLNPNGQSVFSGPLGIGTTGPATPLHVSGASIFGGDSRFNLRLDDTAAFAAGVGAGIQFVGKIDASGTLAGFASIKGIKENGTSGNPSGALSLITNSNTGSNVERMRIDSAGNVGIGRTPIEKLTVAATNAELLSLRNTAAAAVTNMSYIYFGMKDSAANDDYFGAIAGKSTGVTNGSENGALAFSVKNSGAWNQALYIQNDGSVGIGNSSPTTALDLSGALTVRAIAAPSVSPASQGRIYFDSTANVFKVSENGGAFVNLVGGSSQWTTSGSNIYYNAGNVGIGTTGPTNKLSVGDDITAFAGGNAIVMGKTTANSAIGVGQSGTDFLSMQWNYNAVPANAYAEFYSGNHNIVFTPGTGKIGIGTATPGMKLDILPGTGVETAFRIQSSGGVSDNFYIGQWGGTGSNWNLGGQNAGTMNLYINRNAAAGDVIIGATNGGANSRVLMIQGSTGNVGIGTTGPAQKLDVSGDVLANNYRVTAGVGYGYCFWNDCTNYKIHMGNSAEYQYGPVTDYSIKTNMNSGASTRGWTWGYTGATPVAAISGAGHMQLAGNLYAMGNVGIGTTGPSTALDLNGALTIRAIAAPSVSPATQGRIYFDSTANKFKVSENGGVYANLVGGSSQWTTSGSNIYTTIGVGIGTAGPFDTDTIITKSAVLPSGRSYLSCAQNSATNKIYCFGGYGGTYLNQIVEYNPATDTIITKSAVLPSARNGLSCAQNSATNKIYCFGGYYYYNSSNWASLNQIVEYNPATDTLTTKSAVLPTVRSGLSCVENSATNKIYCFGGGYYSGSNIYLNQIVEYNPATDTLTTKSAVLPTGVSGLSCAQNSATNKIYCFGGSYYPGGNFVYPDQIVEYNSATDTITTKSAVLPSGRAYLSCAQNSATNKIYCFGGNGSNQIVEYYPATDVLITESAVFPTGVNNTSCVENSATNKIYCSGGNSGGTYFNQIVEYYYLLKLKVVGTLDIVGNIKIADGTQGAGKVLTSDANGLASWQNSGVPSGYCIFPKPTILTCPSGYTSFTIPLLSHAHNMLEYVSGGGFYYDTASNSSGQQFMCCKD